MNALKYLVNSIIPMTDEDFDYLSKMTEEVQIKKGDYLLEQGQVCRQIYFLE